MHCFPLSQKNSYYCDVDSAERLFSDVEATDSRCLSLHKSFRMVGTFMKSNKPFSFLQDPPTIGWPCLILFFCNLPVPLKEPLVPNHHIALLLLGTLHLLDSGIHLACAVSRKFYEGPMDWVFLPNLPPELFQHHCSSAKLCLSDFCDLL